MPAPARWMVIIAAMTGLAGLALTTLAGPAARGPGPTQSAAAAVAATSTPRPTTTTPPSPTPTSTPQPPVLTRLADPLLGYEIAVPGEWVEPGDTLERPPAPGVRRYGPVQVSVGTPDGTINLCDMACREVTGATSTRALEHAAGAQGGLTMNAWAVSDLDGEPGTEIRVRLDGSQQAKILRRQLAIHDGRPVVIDFDMSDGRVSGELRARIRDSFHFLQAPPETTAIVAPDGSYEIALTERWRRRPDVGGLMVFHSPRQQLTIAAADSKGRIATCITPVGAWEECGTATVGSRDDLEAAIKPERVSEHGMGGPIVVRDVTALGGEPAVSYQVQAYEYPAHGAEWVTYVAAMHRGRAYILRVWTPAESGIVGLDELLAGFRFLD